MELKQLRSFLELADKLNLSQAAKELGICAPPLWMQMRKLEAFLGVDLFRTHRHKLQLTAEGQLFVAEARTILDTAARGVTRVRSACGNQLSIACDPLVDSTILPKILVSFRRAHPQVEIGMRSLRAQQQLADLAAHRLDVGFICTPIPSTEDVTLTELCRQPFMTLVPKRHPLSEVTVVSFEALAGSPLVVYSRALDRDCFERIAAEFRRVDGQMVVACEVESPLWMIDMVAAGYGCGIAPRYVSQVTNSAVVSKPLASAQLERALCMVTRKDQQDAAAVFADFVSQGFATGPGDVLALAPRMATMV